MFGGNGAPPSPKPLRSAKPGGGAGVMRPGGFEADAEDAEEQADAAEPRPAASTYLADLWALDLETWEWHELEPTGQVQHALEGYILALLVTHSSMCVWLMSKTGHLSLADVVQETLTCRGYFDDCVYASRRQ